MFAMIAYGVLADPAAAPKPLSAEKAYTGDAAFYRDVIARLQKGDDFYVGSAEELRRRGGALIPFLTVRPPLLARMLAAFGLERGLLLLQALAAVTAITVTVRLRNIMSNRVLALLGALLAAVSIAATSTSVLFHESWAGILVVLAIAAWSPRTWWVSLGSALTAAALRELAAPCLLVMLAMALLERRWREGVGWAISIGVFLMLLYLHARNVAAVQLATDTRGPAWLAAGGWPFVLRLVQGNSFLVNAPHWVVAVLVPVALVGWLSWAHPISNRASLYLVGMLGTFLLFGRPANVYWGMMVTPLLPVGVVLALIAFWSVARPLAAPAPA